MDILGVTDSVERKIVAAVTLQFGAAVLLALLPFVTAGTTRTALSLLVLTGAAVAFGNTLLIARRDFVEPVQALESAATTIAAGELDDATVDVEAQDDEIGSLVDAFAEMESSLRTISAQAGALSRCAFDADVLDDEVPGSFGDDLDRMTDNLRTNTRELEALTETLERTADRYGEVMAAAADKDLSVRMDPDVESEAMADIARSFNRMLDDLEGTVGEVCTFADTVSALTAEASAELDHVAAASQEIRDATDDISTDADEQRDQLQVIAGEMSDLSATVEEIAASADSVADVATRTAEMGDAGREAATDALDSMDAIQTRTAETMDQLRALDDQVARMGDIVSTISEVADQTNLLALNASIEAAHANGDADDADGFAVVADEVKSLAEETQTEATDIQDLIDGVQRQTTATVEGMQRTTAEVNDAVDTVEEAIRSLERIAEHAQETDEGMREIKAATDEQAASTEETVSMIERIEGTSRDTATEASGVASDAERQAESLADVSARVDDLADRADTLLSLLAEFDVDETTAADATPAVTGASSATD
jgi:methyl-accepting chemotaxis protein